MGLNFQVLCQNEDRLMVLKTKVKLPKSQATVQKPHTTEFPPDFTIESNLSFIQPFDEAFKLVFTTIKFELRACYLFHVLAQGVVIWDRNQPLWGLTEVILTLLNSASQKSMMI